MEHPPGRLTTTAVTAYHPPAVSHDTTVSAGVLARIEASVPGNTRRAYAGDWQRFAAWCELAGLQALPATPETLAEYASHLADLGRAPATIMRALASVSVVHQLGGRQPPSLLPARATVKGYRKQRADGGLPNARPASALPVGQLRQASAALDPADIRQLRDRVVLVLGWAMMARRGTLAALDIADVARAEGGLDVTVRRGKADQEAEGRAVAVPYGSDPLTCPVRITLAWIDLLAARGIQHGPLLRYVDRHGRVAGEPGITLAGRTSAAGRLSGWAINEIVQRAGLAAGIDVPKLTAHSLRAGGASGAHLGGADLLTTGRHGGWTDGSKALLGYIRDVDRWARNPMYKAGL